ncbi:outer membrane beta-barrel protein [Vibrio rhizosphaerae]|uniref:outer membrane beta-barrel protein n=1 Tax=Vibrio rhizosphaerae TaxID=398736 RepID=UPI00056F4BB4|nr:outer membrane beta-barrel protein [Vibrio rhizosphaerae]
MKKTLIGLALLGASTSAFADSWIYGGASVGQSDFKGEHGTAYNIHLGTGILPLIGVEGGFTKFEEIDVSPANKTKATSAYLALKPSIDFGPLHIYAKGGLHFWDEKVNGAKVDDGVDIMYGVGAEYFLMGPVSFGASYQTYVMGDDDMKTFNLNATFHFL